MSPFQLFDIDEIDKIMEETREGAEYQEVSGKFEFIYLNSIIMEQLNC